MPVLPELVSKEWENKEDAVVLTTVDQNGCPNSIYATCVAKNGEDKIVIANNYFDKTMKNISSGSKGSILFITKKGNAYQIKGSIEYHTDGPIFENMKLWNPKEHPGKGAAVVNVEEVYSGAEKLL